MAHLKENRRIINQAKSKKPSRCFLSTPGTPAAAARRPPWSAGWNPRAAPSPASSLPQLDPPAVPHRLHEGKLPFTQVVPLRSWAPKNKDSRASHSAARKNTEGRQERSRIPAREACRVGSNGSARDGDSAPWESRLGGGERGARRGLLGGCGEDRSGAMPPLGSQRCSLRRKE